MVTQLRGTSTVPMKTTGKVLSTIVKPAVRDDVIFQLESLTIPFTKLLKMLGRSRVVGNRKFSWLEREDIVLRDLVSATVAIGGGTLYATNYEAYKNNSLWLNERTREVVQVSSDATSTSVAINRSIGAVPAAAMVTGDNMLALGNSWAEAENMGTSATTQKTRPENYIQDSRDPWDMSDHQVNADIYGPADEADEERFQFKHHMKKNERTLFFGQKAARTTTTVPEYDTGGLQEFITTNVFSVTGTGILEEPELNAFLSEIMRFGSDHKTCFCGERMIRALTRMASDKLQISAKATEFGLQIRTFFPATGGRLDFIWHPQVFRGDVYGKQAWILDIPLLSLVYYKNIGATHLRDLTDATTGTKIQKEWRTNFGLERVLEKAHGIIKGIEG